MHKVQRESMMDIGFVSSFSYVQDDLGQPVASYINNPETVCGFRKGQTTRTKEAITASGPQTVTIDATVRLPLGTIVKATDRFTLVSRRFVAIDPIVFEVVSHPLIGLDSIICDLRAVYV